MNQEAVESAVATASTKASYGTAGAMGLAGWLTSDIVFGLIGVLIGAATWAVNAYYRRKADNREKAAQALEAEYQRRAEERADTEFKLRMKREYGPDWGQS